MEMVNGETALPTVEVLDSAPQGCELLCLCVHVGSVPADTRPSLVSVDATKEEPE